MRRAAPPRLHRGGQRGQLPLQRGQLRAAWIGLSVAALFWLVLFGLRLVNFWAGLAVAAVVLTLYSRVAGGSPWRTGEWNRINLIVGLVAAGVLYAIFAGANGLSRHILPFAAGQVQTIYAIQSQANPWLIGLVLLLITSPAEEIFWRGFLQRRFGEAVGPGLGWLMGTLCYGAVHLFSGNVMLIGAALVAGAFWGLLYLWRRSVVPGIVSHAVWAVLVFLLFPFGGSTAPSPAGIASLLSGMLSLPVASAFVVPGSTPLTEQSKWEYDSNLGKVTVRVTEMRKEGGGGTPTPARPAPTPSTYFRWELSVRGLVYQELLEVRGDQLLTWERSARAFGPLYHDIYSYPVPEYGMPEPLRQGAAWQWQGTVYRGVPAEPGLTSHEGDASQPKTSKPPAGAAVGQARSSGRVVGWEKVVVPAGEYGAWHVCLERSDTFGACQTIEIWVNPSLGVVRAVADLRWGGVIGKVQRLIGLDHFTVQLTATNVR